MARKRKNRKSAWPGAVVAALALLFVLLVNFGQDGKLPVFLQQPLEQVNSGTGGLIFPSGTSGAQRSGLTVRVMDVGQADSILIDCDGKTMLIDGGNPENAQGIESQLQSLHISALDYVVGTHPHADHIGGLAQIIRDYKVGAVIMTDAKTNTTTYANLLKTIAAKGLKITRPTPGQTLALGGGSFTVIAPSRTDHEDLNDDSVVLRLVYGEKSFLFTGDASKESERDMLKTGLPLHADVLKVGHHGSSTATTAAFLKAVSPAYAVISVGRDNTYGLPDEPVIARLQTAGCKLYRTDRDGTVIFSSDGHTISVGTGGAAE